MNGLPPRESGETVGGSGIVFVKRIVSSDSLLPFGDLRKSGLEVELSRYRLHEFTSKRTIN